MPPVAHHSLSRTPLQIHPALIRSCHSHCCHMVPTGCSKHSPFVYSKPRGPPRWRLTLAATPSSSPGEPNPNPDSPGSAPADPPTYSPPSAPISMWQRRDPKSTLPVSVPLSAIVRECERVWFNDAMSRASDGDASAYNVLAESYELGRGCPLDVRAIHPLRSTQL